MCVYQIKQQRENTWIGKKPSPRETSDTGHWKCRRNSNYCIPWKQKTLLKMGKRGTSSWLPSPKAQRMLEKRSIKTRVRGQESLLQNWSSGHMRAIAFMSVQPSCLSKTYTDEPSRYFSLGGGDPSLRWALLAVASKWGWRLNFLQGCGPLSVACAPVDEPYIHVSVRSTKCVQCLLKEIREKRMQSQEGYVRSIWEKLTGEAAIGSKYTVYGHKAPKE